PLPSARGVRFVWPVWHVASPPVKPSSTSWNSKSFSGNTNRRKLVTDFLASLLAQLQSLPLHDRRFLPRASGIYVVLDEQQAPLYVGSSVNLSKRWATHEKYQAFDALGCQTIFYELCAETELDTRESTLIHALQPRLNSTRQWLPKR